LLNPLIFILVAAAIASTAIGEGRCNIYFFVIFITGHWGYQEIMQSVCQQPSEVNKILQG
jgi:hypothetical protein